MYSDSLVNLQGIKFNQSFQKNTCQKPSSTTNVADFEHVLVKTSENL